MAAYNNGKLHGIWMDACAELDEIREQVNKVLSKSPEEDAEEYAIHEFEGFGACGLSEYEGIEHVHELALFIRRA